jgi:hypothetical protein
MRAKKKDLAKREEKIFRWGKEEHGVDSRREKTTSKILPRGRNNRRVLSFLGGRVSGQGQDRRVGPRRPRHRRQDKTRGDGGECLEGLGVLDKSGHGGTRKDTEWRVGRRWQSNGD